MTLHSSSGPCGPAYDPTCAPENGSTNTPSQNPATEPAVEPVRIVIAGGGFAGLWAARSFANTCAASKPWYQRWYDKALAIAIALANKVSGPTSPPEEHAAPGSTSNGDSAGDFPDDFADAPSELPSKHPTSATIAGQPGTCPTPLSILVVDNNNYHTFQPLLYQVAAAELGPEQITYPLRGIFRRMKNVDFSLACITGADRERRLLHTDQGDVPYDYLVLAMGSNTEFYGVTGAETHAFRLKTAEQAIALRNHILTRFELAARVPDPAERQRMLTFTVVGGGPTGVEYAGALAELIRTPMHKDFRESDIATARVVLVEGSSGLLTGYPERLRQYTLRRLAHMGVDVRLGTSVARVSQFSVQFGDGTSLPTETVVWSAGIRGNRAAQTMGLPLGRANRVSVLPTLQVADDPRVFVAGDLALPIQGDAPLTAPTVAPNATQQGSLVAENILRHLRGEPLQPYAYKDKGAMATIGRSSAVVRIGTRTVTGFVAWVLWLFVHLAYLIGFRNRLFVLVDWAWDYLFFERSVRLIMPRIPHLERGKGTPATCPGADAETTPLNDPE